MGGGGNLGRDRFRVQRRCGMWSRWRVDEEGREYEFVNFICSKDTGS